MSPNKNKVLNLLIITVLVANVFAQYESKNVSLVGRWPFGDCRTSYKSGNYVYAGNGTCLDVLDISNPEAPILAGRLITESMISCIQIAEHYVYIANWSDGFRVVDISNPSEPLEIAAIPFEGQCWDVSVFGNYAYVGNDTLGMRIIDISTPASPILVGTFSPPGLVGAEYIHVIDTVAYMASLDGLYIVNIGTPTSPVQIGYSRSPFGSYYINVANNIAYMPEFSSGLRMIDVTNPSDPIEIGYFDTPGSAIWIEFKGNYAYVADGDSGIYILDISNPENPDSVQLIKTNYAYSLHIQGNYLYASCYDEGLRIFDISNPLALQEVGFYDTGGYQIDIYASNNFIYASQFRRGFDVIDNTISNSPVEIANINLPYSQKIHGSDNYVYIVSDFTLKIIDVTNPGLPQQVASWETGGYINSIYISGSYAYLCGNPDLLILDISNPHSPSEVASFNGVPSSPRDIYAEGNYVFLTCGNYGLHIIDISNFAELTEVGSFTDVDYLRAVQVVGNYAYVTDHYLGLMRVIDVSNPAAPLEVSTFQTEEARDLYVSGNYAYLINPWMGLRVIDISDTFNPFECGFFNTGGWAYAIYVDKFIYVADGGGGIYVLQNDLISDIEDETSNPLAFSLEQNYPNPFNPMTEIEYRLENTTCVVLTVYDISGRLIKTLINQTQNAGKHTFTFDASGLASGIYFYKLKADNFERCRKMALIH